MIETKNKPKLLTPYPKGTCPYGRAHSSLLTIIALLLFTACGYKPSSHALRTLFAQRVYVEVVVDRAEPENAPYIKDEMNRIVMQRLGRSLVDKAHAQTTLHIAYNGSRFIPLNYRDGYVTRYRTKVQVDFSLHSPKGDLKKRITTQHESDIYPSALSSSQQRIDAIRQGLEKALDEFLAYASAKGLLGETKR